MGHESNSSPASLPPRAELRYWIGIAAVALVALLIRSYRLGEQSVWPDEYLTFGFLDASSFADYWRMIRFWNFDNSYLYHLSAYLWGQCVGTGIHAQRLFPALLSTGSVVVVGVFARPLVGARGALIAAALLAVAPLHVWYGQSIRQYAMLDVFAPLSFLTLHSLFSESQRRLRPLHYAANAGVLWTHPFGVFLLGTEALVLAVATRGTPGTVLRWGAWQALFAVPVAWLIFRTLGYLPDAADDHYVLPTAVEVLHTLAGHSAFFPVAEFPAALPARFAGLDAQGAARAAAWLGHGLTAASLLAIPALAWIAWRHRQRRYAALLCLAIILLPTLQLLILSHAWRPIMMPRYTAYSAIAVYLAIGMALARVSPARALAGFLLVALPLAACTGLMLHSVTRTNWNAAARIIEQSHAPGDLVLVNGLLRPLARDLFAAHLRFDRAQVEVAPAYSLFAAREAALAHVRAEGTSPPGAAAWVLVELISYAGGRTEKDIEDEAVHPALARDTWRLPGMTNLLLFRVTADADGTRAILPEGPEARRQRGLDLIDHMGLHPIAGVVEQAEALPTLLDRAPSDALTVHAMISLMATGLGQPDLGVVFARHALGRNPAYGPAALAAVAAHAARGDVDAARSLLRQTRPGDFLFDIYRPFLEALLLEGDRAHAEALLARTAPLGFPQPAMAMALAGTARDEDAD